jgi:type IV pilus assembly protein PilE
MKQRNQKGFTLMELMVVIVIVAILAAVAVPLYINYVRDAVRTEAKGAIGAIVTAEQVYYQRNPGAPYTDVIADLNVDLTDVQSKWTFAITNPTVDGFVVTATQVVPQGQTPLTVQYTHSRTNPPADPWVEN